jgi:hypothetical protein
MHGISEQTPHLWKEKYGGLEVGETNCARRSPVSRSTDSTSLYNGKVDPFRFSKPQIPRSISITFEAILI